jgi:hypothetical protein
VCDYRLDIAVPGATMKPYFVAVILAAFSPVAFSGVVIETLERDVTSQKPAAAVHKMYVQGGVARIENDSDNIMIVKNDKMYVLDPKGKSYTVFDKAAAEALAKQINAAMANMRKQMADLPPEQRAQMEAMMSGQMGGLTGAPKASQLTVVDTGRTDKVDSRSCRIWHIKRDGVLDDELCVVAYSTLPGKEDMTAVFKNFAKIFASFASTFPQISEEFTSYTRINGFPVRTRGYNNGKPDGSETVLKSWREEALAPSLFNVPAGYRQAKTPMLEAP